jgi:surface antigen
MLRIHAAVLAVTLAAPAYAVNMSVFKDAPITRLNAEEVKAFKVFVLKTLNEGADGVTAEWKAPKATFTSKITPAKTFEDGKFKCRDTTIDSDSRDRQMRGSYTFCKGDKGDWQFRVADKKGK